MRTLEPLAESWLRGVSALLASLEHWAAGGRAEGAFPSMLADLHAVVVIAVAVAAAADG